MPFNTRILIPALALALGATFAHAATEPAPQKMRHAEARQAAEAKQAARVREASRLSLASLDADADGFVSRDEYLRNPLQTFKRMDANRDGKLSNEEIDASYAQRAKDAEQARELVKQRRSHRNPGAPAR